MTRTNAPFPLPPSSPPPPIVLLVEDDPDTREMYHLALAYQGFWVADAASADLALEFTAQLMPDVIVTDLGLPGCHDGVAFARRLSALERTAGIPVIALTGFDRRHLKAEDGLFARLLTKPIAPEDLIDCITAVLGARTK